MFTSVFFSARGRRWRGLVSATLAIVLASAATVWAQPAGENQARPEVTIPDSATAESLFTDFLHYARLGRFTIADTYARALLSRPDVDPREILQVASRDKKSVDTLLIIIKNSSIGENAAKVLDLIQRGEELERQDTDRIAANIANLIGDPQQQYYAIKHLIESGEHAVPPMVQVLLDPARSELWPHVINAMARLGKPAVTPLAIALSMRNNDVRVHLINALGEIGYPHAIPFLRNLMADPHMPEATTTAAANAIEQISAVTGQVFTGEPADFLYQLGQRYYDEEDSVKADPRLDTANVWYWDDGMQLLALTEVSERIFGQVMAMRCCEEALALQADHGDAIALWLAANIRRESRLGMNIESGDAGETGDPDPTRPAVFPRALYFTQTAGPRYAHAVLARAVRDQDTAVALGAIRALHVTAGETSLVGTEDIKQPLVQALRFPDALVRIRAALALGAALPKSQFADSQFVAPVLAGAITLTGSEQILVVDPDEANLNRVADALRAGGRKVIGEKSIYRALERARAEFQTLTALFIASDIQEPELTTALLQFRSEFMYAKTPVVVLVKSGQSLVSENAAATNRFVMLAAASAAPADLEAALQRTQAETGQARVSEDLALSLALETVDTLRRIAVDGRTVYDVGVAEPALIAAQASTSEELQTKATSVLALARTPSAQQAVAVMALNTNNTESLRLAAFDSLAESAKNNGNLLTEGQLDTLLGIAADDPDLTIRTAASEALGAFNLQANKASEFIRIYHGG
ncbi:MAG: HEAT repeat domain-containing protein [Phycisphaerales bacterium]|nr:MAG: HEAT repeat domain-containing protein [Phycisphaerales bacterium]